MARKYKRDQNGRFAGGGGKTSKAPMRAATNVMRSSAPLGTVSKTRAGREVTRDMRGEMKPGERMPANTLTGTARASKLGQGRRLPARKSKALARKSKAPSKITPQDMKSATPRGTIAGKRDSRANNADWRGATTKAQRRAPERMQATPGSKRGSKGRRLPKRRG